MSKRALGKGLDALFSDSESDDKGEEKKSQNLESQSAGGVVQVPLSRVTPNPDQPRKTFRDSSIQELAQSIQAKGILQPVLLQKRGSDYILVAGERRFRAAQLAELEKIPALIVSYSEEERMEIALVENLQREDLPPIDEARAYESLLQSAGISQDELAKRLGKKRSTIANSLRLIKLPLPIQEALQDGTISPGHARAILSVPAEQQELLFQKIIAEGLSVRQTELAAGLLQAEKKGGKKGKKSSKKQVPELKDLEQKLLDILGTKVTVKGDLNGGKIEIDYYSMDDLERIYDILDNIGQK